MLRIIEQNRIKRPWGGAAVAACVESRTAAGHEVRGRAKDADRVRNPKEEEEEEEELVDPLTTVREQCEQLEKCVKARERLELCDERASSRSHRQRRTAQRSSLTSCMQGTTVWPTNCLTA